VALRRISRGFSITQKPDESYLTEADVETETALRAEIAARYPAHGILGEELPACNPDADFQWIVDPIDGTLAFSRGIPLWGIIVAVKHLGRPVAGVIDLPCLDQRYAAAAGLGTTRNGETIRLSPDLPPGGIFEDVLAVADREQFARSGEAAAFDALARAHPRIRIFPDCFGHVMAVSGAVGATVDFGVRIWDIAATRLLVEEAGGRYVEVWQREISGVTRFGVVLGRPAMVAWVLNLLAGPVVS
jgi:fructose-1,6-bisphosphatase/inositol monophosphatase family enzyme